MTIEEIKAFLDEHKDDVEVQAFMAEINPKHELTADEVGEFLKTDDGKTLVQPMVDQAVTKAVKTRDKAHEVVLENEVKKRVAAEVLKMNPAEEPWQKENRELREQFEEEKKERAKENLKRQIIEEAAKLKIDPFFIEDYVPESIEVGKLYLQKIKTYNDEVVKNTTNELLAGGFKPRGGDDNKNKKKIDLTTLTQDEAIRLEMDGKLDEQLNT